MTDHARPFKRLTEAEALRALYIDFEGEKDRPPVLLGAHRRGRGSRPFVHQDVVDQAFASLSGSVMSVQEAVQKVVLRADHGDRRIVSWSEHDLKPEPGRLADYLALIGYPVPEEAAPGSVGETIRALRGRLERGLPLTPAQRERWDHLVEHNRHDCAGMRRVCLRATGELDAADGR